MTARCLFDRLEAYPDSIHLIEDLEGLTKDRRAVGVLRSALWGTRAGREGNMERVVTWNAHNASEEFVFTGGIIMPSNRRLADLPEVEALKTRISWMHLRISDREVAALMKRVASEGYPKGNNLLEPPECGEVAVYIIREAGRLNRRLDLRLLINSFEDRLQAEDLDAGCSWQDLVAARICERPTVRGEIEPVGVRAQKKAMQLQLARAIAELDPAERLRVWQEKTGASRATMFRRLGELAREDALEF
jgi:hypothetical protein